MSVRRCEASVAFVCVAVDCGFLLAVYCLKSRHKGLFSEEVKRLFVRFAPLSVGQ